MSWKQISNLGGTLTAHPVDPDIIFTTVYNQVLYKYELYKSTDAGENWRIIYISPKDSRFEELLIHPVQPDKMIFFTEYPQSEISEDVGASWRELDFSSLEFLRNSFSSASTLVFDPNSLTGLFSSDGNTVYYSSDIGLNWRLAKTSSNSSGAQLQLFSNEVYFTSDARLMKLTGTPSYAKTAECLFQWAEKQYPLLLSPASTDSIIWEDYIFRYYSKTNTYLGFFQEQRVHLLQKNESQNINDVGSFEYYQNLAGCN